MGSPGVLGMSLSAAELKALGWYATTNNFRPELSAVPLMRFTDKNTGEKVSRDLGTIIAEYQEWNEEDKKRRAAERRRERERQKRAKAR